MATARRACIGRITLAATLFAASVPAVSAAAPAAPAWVRNALAGLHGEKDRAPAVPAVSKFIIDGGGGFVLDRSGRPALLRFDDSGEVWVLAASHGPRGDIIYKDDIGDPMLRATTLGGMTVFTSRRPEGSAAALLVKSSPIKLTPMGPVALYQRLVQASARSTRVARHLVGFEAPNADAKSAAVIADAASVAVDALVDLAARPMGKVVLARLEHISLIVGVRPWAAYQHGVLVITIAPSQGFAGRPSSARVQLALGAS